MIEKLEGIVISEKDFSETSKLLYIITEDKIISVLAKGCKSVKSNLRSCTDKLCYGNFNIYYKKDKLSTLISVDIINNFKNIKKDLIKSSYANFILELSHQVYKHDQDNNIYDLLINSLIKIEEGLNPLALTNILELKLLNYLGVSPSIDYCSNCGSDKQIVTLSSDVGGYICKNCYNNEPLVSDKTIKMIRMYYYVDIKNITKLDVSNEVSIEINRFLDDYYDRYTGLYIKSKDFIKKINSLNKN